MDSRVNYIYIRELITFFVIYIFRNGRKIKLTALDLFKKKN